jgi:hypothetical protein
MDDVEREQAAVAALLPEIFGNPFRPVAVSRAWLTPFEAWKNALAAMRERSSVAEILTLYDGGAISSCEVVQGAWSQCYDDLTLRTELARQFRAYPDENIADFVGRCLEDLAAQGAECRASGSSSD